MNMVNEVKFNERQAHPKSRVEDAAAAQTTTSQQSSNPLAVRGGGRIAPAPTTAGAVERAGTGTALRREGGAASTERPLESKGSVLVPGDLKERRTNSGLSNDLGSRRVANGAGEVLGQQQQQHQIQQQLVGEDSSGVSTHRGQRRQSVMNDAQLSAIIPDIPKKLLSGGKISEDDFEYSSGIPDRRYNWLLRFRNIDDAILYRKHMKKQGNGYLTVALVVLMSFAYIQILQADITLPVALLSVNSFLFLVFLVVSQLALLKRRVPMNSCLTAISDAVLQRFFLWGEIEGVFCVLVTLSFSFAMVFRVARGSCHYDTYGVRYSHVNEYSWWASVRAPDGDSTIVPGLSCNPNDATGGLPYDSLMLMYLLPLSIKLCLKGTHRYAVFLSLLVAMCFLIFATMTLLENGGGNVWIILNSAVFFSFIVYEYERFNMQSFLTSKLALEETLGAERVKYEQDALMLLANQEKVTKEQEHDLLRSLIGNVAHDLKTPLLSLTMGLEQLEHLFVTAMKNNSSTKTMQSSSGKDTVTTAAITEDANELIYNMQASCSFMTMAINRAIDYTKASKNIALVPKMETFDAFDALEFQIRCINSLRASSSAPSALLEIVSTVSALGVESRLCRFLLTDRLWLTENLLCLLSNAVKYSDDDTTAKVTVQLIPAHTPIVPSSAAAGQLRFALSLEPIAEDSKSSSNGGAASRSSASSSSHQPFSLVGGPSIEVRSLRAAATSNAALSQQEERLLPETPTFGGAASGLPSRAALTTVAAAAVSPVLSPLPGIAAAGAMSLPSGTSASAAAPSTYSSNLLTASADMVRVIVEDTGVGVSDDAKRKLFRPFKQAQRFTGGTGLGLFSLSKRMEALGGYYGVTDRLDGKRGSMFWFAFPYRPDFDAEEALKLVEVQEAAAGLIASINTPATACSDTTSGASSAAVVVAVNAPSRPDSILSQSTTIQPATAMVIAKSPLNMRGLHVTQERIAELRVLVVDDSLTIIKMVSRSLEQNGFTVETAKNGSIGLNKLIESNLKPYGVDSKDVDLSKKFDIVLMDLQMPVMDGIEAVTRYRSDEQATILSALVPVQSLLNKRKKSDWRLPALAELGSPVAASAKQQLMDDMELAPYMPVERIKSISDNCTQFRRPTSLMVSRVASRMGSRTGSPGAYFASGSGGSGGASGVPSSFALSLPRPPPVPIVIIGMSANSDAESKQCAKDAGMDYFIEKPFKMSDFLRILDNIEKDD